jgi:hypothetical protein
MPGDEIVGQFEQIVDYALPTGLFKPLLGKLSSKLT